MSFLTFPGDDYQIPFNKNSVIFYTINPGYAGRSEFPDNLKVLFRNTTMNSPDVAFIATTKLFAAGFSRYKELARKITILYKLC